MLEVYAMHIWAIKRNSKNKRFYKLSLSRRIHFQAIEVHICLVFCDVIFGLELLSFLVVPAKVELGAQR